MSLQLPPQLLMATVRLVDRSSLKYGWIKHVSHSHNAKNIARYCVIYFLRIKIQKLRSCQLSGSQQEHSSEGGRHHGPTRPHAAAPQLNNMLKLFSVSQQNKTYRHIVITSVPLTAFSTLPVLIPSITEIYGDILHFILQLTFLRIAYSLFALNAR